MVELTYSVADQDFRKTKSIGIYNFSVHLAQNLSKHAQLENLTVFSNNTVSANLQLTANSHVKDYNYAVRSKLGRIFWDQLSLYRRAEASGHRWLFLPKGFCSFLSRSRVQIAAYVHDIMRDFYDRQYPSFWPKLESQYFARSLTATLQQSRVVFTNTEFSKAELLDLARRHGLREPRVVVAGYGFGMPNGAPNGVAARKENRILLFASSMPHKRTDIALRFLNGWLRDSGYNGVVDCIGIMAEGMEKPVGPSWNWVGRVPPAKAREMIRRSRAVLYVSEYEGFGMPPVEAVLEGTCPVFSDIPPLREVMGETGCPFSNHSQESFLKAMDKALATPPDAIRDWSALLLRRHNWAAVTEKIVQELSTT